MAMAAVVIWASTAIDSEARVTAELQPGFDALLEGVDIVLEFARKEFADLGVQAVHVGDQGQQSAGAPAARLR